MYLDQVMARIQLLYPQLKFVYKAQVWWMRLLAWCLRPINPDFMNYFMTTMSHTVYLPQEKFFKYRPITSTINLCHEIVHYHDQQRMGVIPFALLYLCPQVLVLLALPLLFVNVWLSLCFCLCILPLPALARTYFELRAYAVGIYVYYQLAQEKHFAVNLDRYVEETEYFFLKSPYYFMLPIKKVLDYVFKLAVDRILLGKFPMDDAELAIKINFILDKK